VLAILENRAKAVESWCVILLWYIYRWLIFSESSKSFLAFIDGDVVFFILE